MYRWIFYACLAGCGAVETDDDTDADSDTDAQTQDPMGGTYLLETVDFVAVDCEPNNGNGPSIDPEVRAEIVISEEAGTFEGTPCTRAGLAMTCSENVPLLTRDDLSFSAEHRIDLVWTTSTHVDVAYDVLYTCEGAGCAAYYEDFGAEMPCEFTASATGDRDGP